MLAFPVSYDIIRMKTEENVRIPLRLHNLSRFPRAGFPLLYLLLFLHSHRKRRLEGRLFLVRRLMNVINDRRRTPVARDFLLIGKELSVMSTFEVLYLMIVFATLIVMLLK